MKKLIERLTRGRKEREKTRAAAEAEERAAYETWAEYATKEGFKIPTYDCIKRSMK